MAEFALRSIATMAERNKIIRIPGQVPHLGSQLQVFNDWRYTDALLACIVGLQLFLLVSSLWLTRSVVVLDDSNFVVARLLCRLVKAFEDSGSLLRGKELCQALSFSRSGSTASERENGVWGKGFSRSEVATSSGSVVYGPVAFTKRSALLCLNGNVKGWRAFRDGQHPNGRYV